MQIETELFLLWGPQFIATKRCAGLELIHYILMHSAEQVSMFRVDFSENCIPCRKRSSLQILSTLYAIVLIFSVAVATKKTNGSCCSVYLL